jgi:DNA invertase Pin-like site-specific DNA recombinase
MSDESDNPTPPDDIQNTMSELALLKKQVEHLLSLSTIGEDTRNELEKYKSLKSKGIDIPHLDKEFSEQIFPKRNIYGPKKRPLTESDIKDALSKETSATKAAKRLGVSYPTYKTYARKFNIHVTPGWPVKKRNKPNGPINPHKGKYPIEEMWI